MLQELIARELNPVHDFARVRVFPSLLSREDHFIISHFYAIVNVAKHVVRGSLIGAFVGYTASTMTEGGLIGILVDYISGEPTGTRAINAIRDGAEWGMTLDTSQYVLRVGLSETVKDVYRSIIKRQGGQ